MKHLYSLTIAFFALYLPLHAQSPAGEALSPIHSRLLMFSYDDGMIDYHGLGENNTKDRVLSRPLNTANAGNTAYYSLSSAEDPNYAVPQRPLSVGRKSKGNYFSGNFDAAYPVVMSHAMYLELPHPLTEGASYTLVLDHEALNVVRDTLRFAFVANELRSEALHVNQIGYVADPAIPKYGYLYHWAGDKGGIDFSAFAGQAFRLVEVQTGATAFTGTVAFRGSGSLQENGRSNEAQNYTRTDVWECDFTGFVTPGTYRLAIDGIGCSFPFEIKSDVYRELFYHTARALYHQRSGIAKDNGSTEYAFPRDHHPDDGFEVIMSDIRDLGSGPENRSVWAANTTGDTLRNWYGWYQDAGDWDPYARHMYVPNYLLTVYELYPDRFADGELNIPESGNGIPDILDEASWLVYHLKRTREFSPTGGVLTRADYHPAPPRGTPAWMDQQPWYGTTEDPSSTFFYAGVAAQLAYNLDKAAALLGNPAISDSSAVLIASARSAFDWAIANTLPGDVDSRDFRIRRLLAAIWLYRYTEEGRFQDSLISWNTYTAPNAWDYREMEPIFNFATCPDLPNLDTNLRQLYRDMTLNHAESWMLNTASTRNLRQAWDFMGPTNNGIQSTPQTLPAIVAYYLTGNTAYRDLVHTSADFNLGTNPLNMTWVTGMGERRPDRGVLDLSSWYYEFPGKPEAEVYPGIVPYAHHTPNNDNTGSANGPHNNDWAIQKLYPSVADWPVHETWQHNRQSPRTGEFTINQNMAKAAAVYGFLCAPADGATPNFTPDARPTVSLTVSAAPYLEGQIIELEATAADDKAIERVEFRVDGLLVGTARQAPYTLEWKAFAKDFGLLRVEALAYDDAGNLASNHLLLDIEKTYYDGEDFAILADADASVWSNDPDKNFQTSHVRNGTPERITYIRFQLPNMAQADTAVLRLYNVSGTLANPIELFYIAEDEWQELGITWNNQPVEAGTLIVTYSDTIFSQAWIEIPVTAAVNMGLADNRMMTLRIKNTGTNYYEFADKEWFNQSLAPQLLLDPASQPLAVERVVLMPEHVEAVSGTTLQLETTVYPLRATNRAVSYAVSNPAIATADAEGLLTFHNPGTAVVTVSTDDGGFTAQTSLDILPSARFISPTAETTIPGGSAMPIEIHADNGGDYVLNELKLFKDGNLLQSWLPSQAPFHYQIDTLPAGEYWLAAQAAYAGGMIIADSIRVYGRGPWGGTSATLPGKLEMEDYDYGANGVAYYDNSPGNSGGEYRDNDVDIVRSGTIIAVANTRLNEWLEYTVTVPQADTFVIEAHYTQGNRPNVPVELSVEGTVLATLNFPQTAWFPYVLADVGEVSLPAGTYIIRFRFLNGPTNIDYLRFKGTLPVPATGIAMTHQYDHYIGLGQSVLIAAKVLPEEATNRLIHWSSANDSIAIVSPAGVAMGVSPGTVLITGTTDDGGFTASHTVHVTNPNVGPASLSEIGMARPDLLHLYVEDGYINYHGIGQNDYDDEIVNRPLNVIAAQEPASYTLSSTDDPNYATPQAPLAVGRKSKGKYWNARWPDYPYVLTHDLYLELPHALAEGSTYTLSFTDPAELNLGLADTTFVFASAAWRSEALHVNQLGHLDNPSLPKYGYLYHWAGDMGGLDYSAFEGQPFHLLDAANGSVVFTGSIAFRGASTATENLRSTESQNYTHADVWECDFSAFATPGEYRLAAPGLGTSFPFRIGADLYDEPFYHVTRVLYHQRAGIAKDPALTDWAFPRDHHPDDGFSVKMTTKRDLGSGAEQTNTWPVMEPPVTVDLWGWYQDAGDWDPYPRHAYVPNHLLTLYELTPGSFFDGQLDIPESGNGIPDLLDEAGWLVDYLGRTTALSPTGGVLARANHLTSPPRGVPAWEDAQEWVATTEDPSSTFFYAAVAAQLAYNLDLAASTLQDTTISAASADLIAAAKAAYAWSLANVLPGDEAVLDFRIRRLLAAIWLYKYTGEIEYQNDLEIWNTFSSPSGWDYRFMEVYYGYATCPDHPNLNTDLRQLYRDMIINHAQSWNVNTANNRNLRMGWDNYAPSLNGLHTTPQVMPSVMAYHLTNDPVYLQTIVTSVDYNLGTNPANMSWISGLGERNPSSGILDLNSWYYDFPGKENGETLIGLIPYATYPKGDQTGPANGSFNNDYARTKLYPADEVWPINETWQNNRQSPRTGEFTINQNISPAVLVYGFLNALHNTAVPVTGIALSPDTLVLAAGETGQLTAEIFPANATFQAVSWASANEAIATVDANGLVTGQSAGTTIITATTLDGGHTATAVAQVLDACREPEPAGSCAGTAIPSSGNILLTDGGDYYYSGGELTTSGTLRITNGSTLRVCSGALTITGGLQLRTGSIIIEEGATLILTQNTTLGAEGNGDPGNGILISNRGTLTLGGNLILRQSNGNGSHVVVAAGAALTANEIIIDEYSSLTNRGAISVATRFYLRGVGYWDVCLGDQSTITTGRLQVMTDASNADRLVVGSGEACIRLTQTETPGSVIQQSLTASEGLYICRMPGVPQTGNYGAATVVDDCMDCADILPVAVTGITLEPGYVEMYPGDTTQLIAAVIPADADNQAITWSSSNGAAASVNANGMVIALALGTTIITATSVEGGFEASATVAVVPSVCRQPAPAGSCSGTAIPSSGNILLTDGGDYYYSGGELTTSGTLRITNGSTLRVCSGALTITGSLQLRTGSIIIEEGATLILTQNTTLGAEGNGDPGNGILISNRGTLTLGGNLILRQSNGNGSHVVVAAGAALTANEIIIDEYSSLTNRGAISVATRFYLRGVGYWDVCLGDQSTITTGRLQVMTDASNADRLVVGSGEACIRLTQTETPGSVIQQSLTASEGLYICRMPGVPQTGNYGAATVVDDCIGCSDILPLVATERSTSATAAAQKTQPDPASLDSERLFHAWPNPTEGQLMLSLAGFEGQDAVLLVQDALGRALRAEKINLETGGDWLIDLSDLPAGLYFLRLRPADGKEEVLRVVKAH
jgi:uncharacterized protein YjdB